MNIHEFNKEVNRYCQSCPVIAFPDDKFPMYNGQERAGLAFLLGAATALIIARERGTAEISWDDCRDFLDNNSTLNSLLQKAS